MFIGYARVHSRDRDLRAQKAALHQAGCEIIIEVRQGSSKARRDGLRRAMNVMREGDILVVWTLESAANSLKDIMEVSAILSERHIELKSLEDDVDVTGNAGLLMRHMLTSLAEYERARIRKSVAANVEEHQATFRHPGRPKGIDEAKRQAAMALSGGTSRSITEICKLVGISRTTFYRYKRVN